MLHHVSVKHHFAIGNASLRLFYAEMGFFGSHGSIVYYYHILFVNIIKVPHLYGYLLVQR